MEKALAAVFALALAAALAAAEHVAVAAGSRSVPGASPGSNILAFALPPGAK